MSVSPFDHLDFSKLHPKIREYQLAYNTTPAAVAHPNSISIDERRRNAERSHMTNGGPQLRVRRIEDITIPGRENGRQIEVRLYFPTLPTESLLLPAVLYFHGGGWVVGTLGSHDPFARNLAVQSQAVIISVNYRMAPEHVAPACVEDGIDAYIYFSRYGKESHGIDGSRLGVCGDSAGGNIAAAIALQLVVEKQNLEVGGGSGASGAGASSTSPSSSPSSPSTTKNLQFGEDIPMPLLQALIYPALDMTLSSGHSYTTFAYGFSLRTASMQWFVDMYLGVISGWREGDVKQQQPEDRKPPVIDPKHYLVSPLFAPEEILSKVCPTYILTAGHDPLLSDGEAYRDRLLSLGVKTEYICFENLTHSCVCMYGVAPEPVQQVYNSIGAAVKKVFLKDIAPNEGKKY